MMTSELKTFAIALMISAAGLSACTQNQNVEPEKPIIQVEFSKITGEFTYRERVALRPGAYAVLKINNISRADAPSVTLTERKIDLNGKSVPISYDISVPAMRLNPKDRYAIRIEIRDQADTLLFTTDQVHSIDPEGGDQKLDPIILKKV